VISEDVVFNKTRYCCSNGTNKLDEIELPDFVIGWTAVIKICGIAPSRNTTPSLWFNLLL
jgi:hypothetical protein